MLPYRININIGLAYRQPCLCAVLTKIPKNLMLFVQISFFIELFFCKVSKLIYFPFSTVSQSRAHKSALSGTPFREKHRKSLVETYFFSARMTHFSHGKRFSFVKNDEFSTLFSQYHSAAGFHFRYARRRLLTIRTGVVRQNFPFSAHAHGFLKSRFPIGI